MKQKSVDMHIIEFTDLPEGVKEILASAEMVPDFCCMLYFPDMTCYAVHGPDDETERCMIIVFHYMHGAWWQMIGVSGKGFKILKAVSVAVHSEILEME